jgi:hypothetical protein
MWQKQNLVGGEVVLLKKKNKQRVITVLSLSLKNCIIFNFDFFFFLGRKMKHKLESCHKLCNMHFNSVASPWNSTITNNLKYPPS